MTPKSEIRFLSLVLLVSCAILSSSFWWFTNQKEKLILLNASQIVPIQENIVRIKNYQVPITKIQTSPSPLPKQTVIISQNNSVKSNKIVKSSRNEKLLVSAKLPKPQRTLTPKPNHQNDSIVKSSVVLTPWQKKEIRGIYLSRYQVTNNADEKTIRERVRYYHSQGINTIIHGVWGNGCTMYDSSVTQQIFDFKRCPNEFNDQWLNWMIDEAHQQGMQVHAYFEKGIKLDKNSPIFETAIARKWLIPGVDKTYDQIDHYLLDVEVPEVANLFKNIVVEFVKKYPTIDAVQWDDYLGYYAEVSGKIDRTPQLTRFVQKMIIAMKKANSSVSFDICHHNPYWAKRYFAADLKNWKADRIFIQAYNEKNFNEELIYAQQYDGIAITDNQLGRLKVILKNPKIKSVMIFPLAGNPQKTASNIKTIVQNSSQQ